MTTPTANRKTVDELIHEIEDRANRNISNRNDIKVLLRHLKAVLDLGRARRDERDEALVKVRQLEEWLGASNAELWEAQSRIDNLAHDLAGLRERLVGRDAEIDRLEVKLVEAEQRTMSRRRDPGTSKAGAADVTIRAGSQRFKLLTAYANAPLATHGLTSDQARERAKISERSCYWKRVSELHAAGLIMTAGEREGDAGSKQTVYAITMKGVQALENAS
jgi:hypothetical protein